MRIKSLVVFASLVSILAVSAQNNNSQLVLVILCIGLFLFFQKISLWISRLISRRRLSLAQDPSASPEALLSLASDRRWDVRAAVAANAAAPPEALMLLASVKKKRFRSPKPITELRVNLACNASSGPEVLAAVATVGGWEARNLVAQHLAVRQETLSMLASVDLWWKTRTWVAKRSESADVLALLAKDYDWRVRTSVAGNRFATPDTLTTLSADDDWDVRREVAQNDSTPEGVLGSLLADKKLQIRKLASDKLTEGQPSAGLLRSLALSPEWLHRKYAAGHRDTPIEMLEQLYAIPGVGDSDPNLSVASGEHLVLIALAGNVSSPEDMLSRLAYSTSTIAGMIRGNPAADIRKQVASNSSTPEDALSSLLSDESAAVRAAAISNPRTPVSEIARKHGKQDLDGHDISNNITSGERAAALETEELERLVNRPQDGLEYASLSGSSREHEQSSESNALAGLSLAFGIVGYLLAAPLIAVVGLVCGHAHLSEKAPGPGSGRGMAVFGLIASYVTWAIYISWRFF